MTDRGTILYLLGAGRSGTTLLATVLNAVPGIQTLGELHQVFDYWVEDKPCSCSQPVSQCAFWSQVLRQLSYLPQQVQQVRARSNAMESHRRIPALLIGSSPDQAYLSAQEKLFKAAEDASGVSMLLDSSKYIARFLMLNRSKAFSLTGIYMVRDVRGVIESFGKKVQTPKSPLSTILYYLLINFFGELTYRLYPNVVKVRYEDFIREPEAVVKIILGKAGYNHPAVEALPERFEIPHLIGGNRLKSNPEIKIDPAVKWSKTMSRGKQLIYYFSALPAMLINRYKP